MTTRLHRGDLPDLARYGKEVAIDTETMGLDPRRDRLCVVQLSPGDGSADVVQIPADLTQAPNLLSLLTDPARCQVVLVTLPEETPVNELIDTAYHLEDRVGHRQGVELAGQLPGQRGGRRAPGLGQGRGGRAEAAAEAVSLIAEPGDPVVGVVELGEPPGR